MLHLFYEKVFNDLFKKKVYVHKKCNLKQIKKKLI